MAFVCGESVVFDLLLNAIPPVSAIEVLVLPGIIDAIGRVGLYHAQLRSIMPQECDLGFVPTIAAQNTMRPNLPHLP